MLTSGFFRRRRRAFSGTVLLCATLTVMSMWYISPIHTELFQTSIHRFRLFGGVNEELPSNFFTLPADDPTLVDIVRNKLIRMPRSIGYNLSRPDERDFSRGLSKVIDNAIIGLKKGFYVECGAFDGEEGSITLFFERERQWQGLLVEPNRENYNKLASKHRNAYSINACVRTDYAHYKTPEKSSEKDAYFAGSSSNDVGQHPVPCFWLTTLLLAVERNTVDLLAVDIHGKEQDLMQTIDFHKVNVQSVSVEIPLSYSDTTVKEFIKFMSDKGYIAAHLFADQVRKTKALVFKKDGS